jgi:hypothetical protein
MLTPLISRRADFVTRETISFEVKESFEWVF